MPLRTLAVCCLAALFAKPALAAEERKPNVVLILADDIGYGDLGCYGETKVKTPHLDRLASQGLRFTNAYAPASVCTPTRYALMTGQYAWRNPAGAKILPGDAALSIPVGPPTLPSIMRDAGYATALVGKWHLGLGKGDVDFNGEIKPGPMELGFNSAYFIPATVDRVPTVWIDGHRVAKLDPADPIRVDYQKKIGTEPTGKENPDQLKLKASHGHDMTMVNGIGRIGWMTGGKAARWQDDQIADTIAGRSIAFIEANKDKPFFLYMATHDVHVPRTPHPRFLGTTGRGVRGDSVAEFDDTVGQVLAALDRLKLADDTLVIVTSDNGGVIDDGYADGSPAAYADRSPNAPLRGFKGSLYEGGVREPFIVRYPAKVKTAGQTRDSLLSLIDLPATLAAVAGKEVPARAFPDSINVLPDLFGYPTLKPSRDSLVIQNGGPGLAVRKGQWKLIPPLPGARRQAGKAAAASATRPVAGGGYGAGPGAVAQLFNLGEDLAETKNVAAENPDKVAELTELLEKVKAGSEKRPE